MNLHHPVTIGSLTLGGNVFLAPMADVSDAGYRSMCAECGADFAYTELVSAEALVRGNKKTIGMMARAPNEKKYAVQIFGGSAETMARAAEIVLERTDCDLLDINCGCPVPKVTKTGAGSALTKNPEKLHAVAAAVVRAVDCAVRHVPVTVKIRMGWDERSITWKECADAAMSAGVSAIALHARTAAQGYAGAADWGAIRSLVDFAAGRVLVIGNGDIKTPEDAKRMIEETGCDAIMVARGARGNPFIFTQIRSYLETGAVSEIPFKTSLAAGFRELSFLVDTLGELPACMKMRGRFSNYVKGFEGAKELRQRIVGAASVRDFRDIFREFM